MFGYIVTNRKDLAEDDRRSYRLCYCGLCKALSSRYGKLGSTFLSYDMTFLALLLEDLYDDAAELHCGHCHTHPITLHYTHTRFSDYAADMQILLSLHSLRDKVKDEGKHPLLLGFLEKQEPRLQTAYPRQTESVQKTLLLLDGKEKENCQDPLQMSQIASGLTSELFAPYEDFFHDDLVRLGRCLGRYVYLLDAFDDLGKDQKKHTYNPFFSLQEEVDFTQHVHELLQDAASEAAQILERLPLSRNLTILRNILYSGIWTAFARKENKH